MSLKNPVTPPVIDPGTVRIVPQLLNHYATPGPFRLTMGCINSYTGLQETRRQHRPTTFVFTLTHVW
jgi:hypothetical protein